MSRKKCAGVPDVVLSVVVPAYNEEGRIASSLIDMTKYLDGLGLPYELLVVNDGSTDGTAEAVARFAACHPATRLLSYEANRGKGHAVRYGVLRASGRYVLFCDADLATPMEELEKLLPLVKRGRCQVAIGSRPLRESQLLVRQPLYREMAGRTFNRVVQLVAVPGIHDTQCGFKLFTGEAARDIFSRCRLDGFSFDIETLFLARRLGYSVSEVPIRWMHRPGSKVRFLRDSLRMLRDLVKIRFLHAGLKSALARPWRPIRSQPTAPEP